MILIIFGFLFFIGFTFLYVALASGKVEKQKEEARKEAEEILKGEKPISDNKELNRLIDILLVKSIQPTKEKNRDLIEELRALKKKGGEEKIKKQIQPNSIEGSIFEVSYSGHKVTVYPDYVIYKKFWGILGTTTIPINEIHSINVALLGNAIIKTTSGNNYSVPLGTRRGKRLQEAVLEAQRMKS